MTSNDHQYTKVKNSYGELKSATHRDKRYCQRGVRGRATRRTPGPEATAASKSRVLIAASDFASTVHAEWKNAVHRNRR